MSTVKCYNCGNEVEKKVKICPHCGVAKNTTNWGVLIIVILGAVLLGAFFSYSAKMDRFESASKTSIKNTVINSSWDGSVRQVERFLQKNLKDPDSFEAIKWYDVKKEKKGYWVRCKYRARNSFGGYVIEDKSFFLDLKGNVTNVIDNEL